ncbi:MAG TPA: hypothetical protein VLL08_01025 [Kineosporiaceae bacterium]|nr:hypothetical protein [Kineosporiaceae bacterium]
MTATSQAAPSLRPARTARIRAWFFEPAPQSRIALLRVAIYLFVIDDLFFVVNDVFAHADSSAVLYRPIRLREWLNLPVPQHDYVHVMRWVIIIGCLLCASGRLPRRLGVLVGFVVAAGFTDWVSIGMSYSKIDHDHFALIVAVWVLPTIGVARFGNRTRSEAAGWALLCIQVACVAVYFLSAISKFRYGGLNWPTGSTFAWAITRRGTSLGDLLLNPPWILTASQFLIITLELATPLLLVLRRWPRYLFVIGLWAFHLSTYLTLTIHFLPLVICLLAFLPLESVLAWIRQRSARPSAARSRPGRFNRSSVRPEPSSGSPQRSG